MSQLAHEIDDIESLQVDKIVNWFDNPKFIFSSRVHLIRYEPDFILMAMVKGSSLKLDAITKSDAKHPVSEMIRYLQEKIKQRTDSGFESVDREHFLTEFWIQLEVQFLAKFKVSLQEFWAFCERQELDDADRISWSKLLTDYKDMMKAFYHSMPLYEPGIRLN